MSFAPAYSTYYTNTNYNLNTNPAIATNTNPNTLLNRGSSSQPYSNTNFPISTQFSGAAKPKSEANKLGAFLNDCLFVGCLKGFKFFEVYLRGREELLLRVYNQPSNHPPPLSKQPSSKDIARNRDTHQLPSKILARLAWQSTDTLPPASPCDRELEKDHTKTAFLIAGYARYKCPFVWLRTNHASFAKSSNFSNYDDPIKLQSVTQWKTSDSIWVADIIAEILFSVITPPISNPFEINHFFFDTLPIEESVICCGAMLRFLQRVFLSDSTFSHLVLNDMRILMKRFWTDSFDLNSYASKLES